MFSKHIILLLYLYIIICYGNNINKDKQDHYKRSHYPSHRYPSQHYPSHRYPSQHYPYYPTYNGYYYRPVSYYDPYPLPPVATHYVQPYPPNFVANPYNTPYIIDNNQYPSAPVYVYSNRPYLSSNPTEWNAKSDNVKQNSDSKLVEDVKLLKDELKSNDKSKSKIHEKQPRFLQQWPTINQPPSYFTSLAANSNSPGAVPINQVSPLIPVAGPATQSYVDPHSTSSYAQAPVQTQAAGPYYESTTNTPAYYYGYQPMLTSYDNKSDKDKDSQLNEDMKILKTNLKKDKNKMRFMAVENPNSAAPTSTPSKSQPRQRKPAYYPGYVLHAPYGYAPNGYYVPATPYPAPYCPALLVQPASSYPGEQYYGSPTGYPVYYGYNSDYLYSGPTVQYGLYDKKDKGDTHLKSDMQILKDELKDKLLKTNSINDNNRFVEIEPMQKKQTHVQAKSQPTQVKGTQPTQVKGTQPTNKKLPASPYGHPMDLNHDPYFEPPVTTHRSTPNLFKDTQSFYPPRQYFINDQQQYIYYTPSGYQKQPPYPQYPAPQEFPYAFSGENLAANMEPSSKPKNSIQSDIAVLKSELKNSKSNEIFSKKFRFNQWTSPLDNASPDKYPIKMPPYMPHKRLMFNPWNGYYSEHVDGQYGYHPSLQPVAKKRFLTDVNFPGPEPHAEGKPHILGVPFKNPLHPVVGGKELVVSPNNPVTPYIEK